MPKLHNNKSPRTKIEKILMQKKWTQQKFLEVYNSIHAGTPMMAYHFSRIVSGKFQRLNVETVYKICYVLKKRPNDILDFEKHLNDQ